MKASFALALALTAVVLAAVAPRLQPESSSASSGATYTVQPGDTLWALAERFYAGDARKGVWLLRKHNDLVGVRLEPGKTILLP